MFKAYMYDWCCKLQDRVPPSQLDHVQDHVNTCMRLVKEVSEVLDCVDWKTERDDPKLGAQREDLLEELVDCFNYLMRLMWLHSVNSDEFEKAWDNKARVIERRLLDAEKLRT